MTMYYKCNGCGRIFEEIEAGVGYNDLGLCFGYPCEERITFCPFCCDELEEMETCKICGKPAEHSDTVDGICKPCLYDEGNDIETCYKVGETYSESVKLNCFVADMFDSDEINEILLEVLRERNKKSKIDCTKFIADDPYFFADALKEIKEEAEK